MKFGKGLVAGVLALGMVFGVGSSVSPVDAMNQKPDDGKAGAEKGQVYDVYLHGVLGTQNSLSTMIRSTTGAKLKGSSQSYGLKYSGQFGTFICKQGNSIFTSYFAKDKEVQKRRAYDVIFVNNINSVKSQYEYIKRVVDNLTAHGARVNLIGHSMGGLSATSYVTHYESKYTTPRVNKLITIGSPITGSSTANSLDLLTVAPSSSLVFGLGKQFGYIPTYARDDLKVGSKAIKDIFSDDKKINPKIKVYSIYGGNKNSNNPKGYEDFADGVVSKPSATALKYRVSPKNYKSYYAEGVDHVSLMSSKKVAKKVSEWINEK